MGKQFTSLNSLKAALLSETREAVKSTVQRTHGKLQEDVEYFYSAPEGTYHRTGQLKASPQIDGLYETADGAIGQVSISTRTQYDPAGRDTEWIYNAAEDGALLGHGGFWQKTLKFSKNFDEEPKSLRDTGFLGMERWERGYRWLYVQLNLWSMWITCG
ncbi:MAG: hypothetical protein LUI13_05890 [Lachnospiraceae bacterium]|nr:hypothetical protein [Lachnospiraceae bacterium]